MAFSPLKKFLPPDFRPDQILCGLDEVGRGSWAGPLLACALVLKKDFVFKGLTDSKGLTPAKREKVFKLLQKYAVYGLGQVEAKEIDRLGLTKALHLAFTRALQNLPYQPDYLLIDGRDKFKLPYAYRSVIKGDKKIKVIACASIIAKVTRDRLMVEFSKQHSLYGFEIHKGYGTERHQKALQKHGVSILHRRSFKPVFERALL